MKAVYLDEETRSIADLYEIEEVIQQNVVGIPDPKGYPMWMISRINVPEKHRGKGIASKLLREIIEDADRERVVLIGWPSSSGGLSRKQLEDWYKRHGYQKAQGSPMLVRFPKGTER